MRSTATNGREERQLVAIRSERLRADARTELLPVVILTSSDEQKDRLKSYENGCNSFVQKPVDFADFAETVARLGVYWLATNEPPPERPLQR